MTLDDSSPLAGRAAALAGDAEGVKAAVSLLSGTGLIGQRSLAQIAELQACVAALEGRRGKAIDGFAGAAETFRRRGMAVDLALLVIARATLVDPPDPENEAVVAETLAFLKGIGARPFVTRLEAAAGRKAAAPAAAHVKVRTAPS